jgi:hypothetical protein
MKAGDLVKLRDGTTGIITKIIADDPFSRRIPWAMLHTGEKCSLRDLEVISEIN